VLRGVPLHQFAKCASTRPSNMHSPRLPQSRIADEKPSFDSFLEWAKALPPENFNSRGKIEQMYKEKLGAEGLT